MEDQVQTTLDEYEEAMDKLRIALIEAESQGVIRLGCQTHDAGPVTAEQAAEWEEGHDPCHPVVWIVPFVGEGSDDELAG